MSPLDLESVMTAAHAISSEMHLDRLLDTVVRIMLEISGAHHGCVLLEESGAWVVAASREVGAGPAHPKGPGGTAQSDHAAGRDLVSEGVVQLVAGTRQLVALDDAAREGPFVEDPHVRRRGTRSLLCAPLISRGRLVGLVHLENNLAPRVFTADRVRLVELLAAQAATSLDNARVFAALEASEAQNRRIVSTAAEGIIVLGEDGMTIRFVNARMAEMLGSAEDSLLGQRLTDLLPEAEIDDHWRRIEARRSGLSEHYERRLRRADGTDLWTLASATPITAEDGSFAGSFGMFTDITERKHAEQELALVSYALDHVGEAAFLIDEDGRFRQVNEEACRSLARSRQELLAMSVWDIDPVLPASRWRDQWEAVRSRQSHTFASRHRASDGRSFPVEISASYFEFAGRPQLLALARDSSEQVQAQETIRQLNADLEATIAAIPDLMFELDRDGRYLAVNSRHPELLAAPPEELIGRTLGDVLPAEAIEVSMAGIREAEEDGASYGRVVQLEVPGGHRWFEQSIARKARADGGSSTFVAISRDITERMEATEALRRSAEELRQSEERYRLIFDNVRDSLYLLEVTEDGRFRNLEVNPALCVSTGLTREQMVGRTQEEVVGPEVAATVNAGYAACVARGEIIEGRRELQLPTGLRIYDTTLIPVRNDHGRVDRIVGLAHDVTERELAERARHATELTYQTLLEQASEAVFVNDADRRYTDVNIVACEILGYSRKELLGLSVRDVTRPEDNPGQEERFRRMMAGETVISERLMRRRDGALVPVELSTRRLPDGRFMAMGRDVSERRRAAEEQARLVAVVEQAAEAIVITDPGSAIIYVNPAYERVSGYARDELLGRNPRILQSGQHDPAFYRAMWEALLDGKTWHGTIVNRRKDGTLFEEDSSISPIYDAAGGLLGYAGVKRDVTRERALETQLRQAQKMEAVGQLAGGIAHDFNNLITAIRGYAEFIRDGLGPDDSRRGDVDQVLLAADRAADLTRQLLAFSRRLPLQPRVVAPAEVVDRLAPMLRRLLGEHIELVTDAMPASGRVLVDPSQLEQVIVNLAVNARDAMPGGGRLMVETTSLQLEGGIASHPEMAPGPYVTIRVTDTGMGMSEETRRRAFEPFFSTKEAGKGTGMGLATVYGIITASGGTINLYSEPGRGTSFRIYLPQVEEEATPVATNASLPLSVPSGTETILLVEDEAGVRSFGRRALEGLGYEVLEAENGAEALDLAREHGARIDLVVSDVVMPRMGGAELAERLRAARPDIRVLLVSGFAEEQLGGTGLGDDRPFLAKPFSREALGRAVRQALDAPR